MAKAPAPSAADMLLRIIAENYYISRTVTGEPFAVRCDTPSVMVRLRGNDGLRQRLAADMFRQTGRGVAGQALADVLTTVEGVAFGRRQQSPALRIARAGQALYLDLGRPDGWAVEIRPGRWRVVTRPPVLFARTALTGELPLPPEGGGSLEAARSLVNVRGDAEWALYVACRICSLFPGITHPIEAVTGPTGAAKTSTTKLTANWIDPAGVMTPVPRDGRTWAAMAASRYTQPVDNVSWIPPWWSDLLCKAASGDGWVDRALYTDGDVYVAAFQSVIILNGISLGHLREDLANRIVAHRLSVPPLRRSDDELDELWRVAHPAALAWLLDRTCEIMADIALEPPPAGGDRLVRFAQIVRCVDQRWGTHALAAWRAGAADVLEDVADSDPVAVAVRKAVGGPVSLAPAALLDLLRLSGGLENEGRYAWTPKTLSEHLERCQGALASLGWQVWRHRDGGGSRMWCMIPPAASNGHGQSLIQHP